MALRQNDIIKKIFIYDFKKIRIYNKGTNNYGLKL